ncbi:MAG: protein phosphatase 2C domain-containing protein [Prevotellaceae bacterium]|nr:protein phosphatase 2C domain-containing protein [Prevotellaceae bacterium]
MKYKLCVYSIWEAGKRVDAEGKPHQEDDMYPAHGCATDKDRLFILCDGMGGHEAGEVASATVCEAMSHSILSATPDPEGDFPDELFHSALKAAFSALDEKDDGRAIKKMGTTMTLLKLHRGGCLIAHMGDSRVYHIRPASKAKDTRILFRTEDHSLVNDLVKIGELTPEEAKRSPRRNVITRALQPHMDYQPKADLYHTSDIQPGDFFYLCTDGMLENMDDEQLAYYFSSEAGDDQQKVNALIEATKQNRDNHSAIIVHILEVDRRRFLDYLLPKRQRH